MAEIKAWRQTDTQWNIRYNQCPQVKHAKLFHNQASLAGQTITKLEMAVWCA